MLEVKEAHNCVCNNGENANAHNCTCHKGEHAEHKHPCNCNGDCKHAAEIAFTITAHYTNGIVEEISAVRVDHNATSCVVHIADGSIRIISLANIYCIHLPAQCNQQKLNM